MRSQVFSYYFTVIVGNLDVEGNNIHNLTNTNTLSTGICAGINNTAGTAPGIIISTNTIDTLTSVGTAASSLVGIYNTQATPLDMNLTLSVPSTSGTGILAGIIIQRVLRPNNIHTINDFITP